MSHRPRSHALIRVVDTGRCRYLCKHGGVVGIGVGTHLGCVARSEIVMERRAGRLASGSSHQSAVELMLKQGVTGTVAPTEHRALDEESTRQCDLDGPADPSSWHQSRGKANVTY